MDGSDGDGRGDTKRSDDHDERVEATRRAVLAAGAALGAGTGLVGIGTGPAAGRSAGNDGERRSGDRESAGPPFGVDAGFADTSWLDDDARVIVVEEATREAVAAAFEAEGPRVVAFATSGTIDLSGDPLAITEPRCWVAGQTAPSPGITFVGGPVQVAADDCVLQHVRSRIGPGPDGEIQGNDAINTADGTENVVLDHVTASWGTDECLSVGYDTDRTTVTNSLIYEGLYDPYGDGSDHNYCTLVGDGADRVALLGNTWAKARSRIPRLKEETRSVVANNLAYFFDEACAIDDSAATSYVGNAYVGVTARGESIVEGDGTVYAADNLTADPPVDDDVPFVETEVVAERPLWPDGLDPVPAREVGDRVLPAVGARPADRTANDRRIVREIRDRAGNDRLDEEYDYWLPDPSAAGGYPDLSGTERSLSVPETGLRAWLAEHARRVEGRTGDDGDDGTDGPPPVDGTRPADPDGDGDYEDLNANGRVDYDDVVTYFRFMEEAVLREHPGAYDYNDDDRIDYSDLVALFDAV